MTKLLTSRQVQDLLKVDRITIYRMLQDGRLQGVKVGRQWRFELPAVQRLLNIKETATPPAEREAEAVFPVHCVQTIQDLYAEVGRVSGLVVDQHGDPVTAVSRPTAFCHVVWSSAIGQAACRASWRAFAAAVPEGQREFTCHAGLNYVAAPIQDGDAIVGAFLAGQFRWQTPENADPARAEELVKTVAATCRLSTAELRQASPQVPRIAPTLREQVSAGPLAAARAVQSILHERIQFMDRLQKIANLTQIS